MKAKWFISLFLFISLCFGAFQEHTHEPNQEIVFEYTDTSIGKVNFEQTLKKFKEKLLKNGATNITIKETKKGVLKIAYYSTVKVDDIKKVVFGDLNLGDNKNSEHNPEEKQSFEYNINIYELTDQVDISNLDDKLIIEIKSNSERFTVNNVLGFSKILESKANLLFKTAYKFRKNNPFTKDYTSYQEPEVRAGPKNSIV